MKLVVKAKNGAKPAKEFTLVEGKDYKVKYECKEGNLSLIHISEPTRPY